MKIVVGADHRGFVVKGKVLGLLARLGHEIIDVGTDGIAAVDYPDFAGPAAQKVAAGEAERGILICGSGIGMCIAANKVSGIRAATCPDEITAEMCRRHNDVNVLCLSADLLGEQVIDRMIEIWLNTGFEGGRHARRVEKVKQLEESGGGSG